MPRGSLDIGSNSLLLLIQDDQGRTLHDEARVVGLGRGLGDRGMFRPDRMDAAMEVFDAYAQTVRQHGLAPWDVRAIATSASRRALNSSTFYARVAAETGFRVEVISGEEEARLTWLGARAGLAIPSGPLAVIDLGGGSTEVVIGEEHLIGARVSLEVGSVRLTERFLPPQEGGRVRPQDLYQLRAYVEKTLGSLVVPVAPRTVLAVAGSATTLGAMELGLETWDRERVHGMRLTRAALRRWIDRLLEADSAQRRQLCRVSPERADTLLAGACVLDAVAEHLRKETLRISDGGVRHGVLLEN